jgi:hypothetical protein
MRFQAAMPPTFVTSGKMTCSRSPRKNRSLSQKPPKLSLEIRIGLRAHCWAHADMGSCGIGASSQ